MIRHVPLEILEPSYGDKLPDCWVKDLVARHNLLTMCRYVPLGIIWDQGSYPTVAAGYDDKFAVLRKWVLARLAWMEGQLKQVCSTRFACFLAKQFCSCACVSKGAS